MATLNEQDLKLFVDSIRNYLKVTTRQEPQITSAFLGTGDVEGFEFNGIVTFSGSHNGHVVVSMPDKLVREVLLLQHETDMSAGNLLDAVGEIANTLAGNARKVLGSDLQISVPIKMQGANGIKARVRKRPYVITLRWNHYEAMVCVDMERRN
ncbi:MAG TPA: chemotaxis protein CheX [Polaromonas sp.]|uniref:chemotaxis protein CheX n=1 Tax=Polaromonas sp. TaxID=1869339 RepID=UPI002D571A41|nr:chemotaxis protein CheX [Polaromonas sp.]HYW57567.1 chemotaxis protein CheX [Polaromonas sp.]